MFETAEVGNTIDKAAFGKALPGLRAGLLEAQGGLAASSLAVAVLLGGVEGAGKADTVNRLLEWMDARGVETHVMGDSTDEERERPPMWRFWRALPPKGRMGIFIGTWYTEPIVSRTFGSLGEGRFNVAMDRIAAFETMLSKEGVLVFKIWLHIPKETLKKRLKKLASSPATRWRVNERDWKYLKRYDRFRAVSEKALRRTGTGEAPWHIVEATDPRYRDMTVATLLKDAIQDRLAQEAAHPKIKPSPDRPKPPAVNIIKNLDLSQKLSSAQYDRRHARGMTRVNLLTRKLYEKQRSLILVFEGPDAAGKGGAIRRLTSAMDARNYQHIAIAAPTDEERAHPYLWRFWRALPRRGRVTIYDRSWYGRVLVERIEGFCHREEWERAFVEINAFEESLTQFDTIVLKFWLAISSKEQLRRFKERQVTPYKQYKITEEDWRNRAKWEAYEAAALEMIDRTSS
ncbi:MAG: polyphosphate:AMP phosphotransferase, partial [Acidobacteria bacterium 37-65-4]